MAGHHRRCERSGSVCWRRLYVLATEEEEGVFAT